MKTGRAALDDPTRIAAVDRSGMLLAVAGLGRQLRRGFEAGRGTSVPEHDHDAIVVCGMGGSGIAGDVVRGLLADRLRCPIVVSKGYALPTFCGPKTLLLAVSYSGNTEETIAAYEEGAGRECRTVSVSAGGRLRELAEVRKGFPGPTSPPMCWQRLAFSTSWLPDGILPGPPIETRRRLWLSGWSGGLP